MGDSMEIATKQYKHCDVVTVKGRVDSATTPKLAETFEALASDSRFKIILDLKGLEYMSSAGFRAVLNAQKTCRRYNRGELVLVNVPQNIREAFDIIGMTSLFKQFNELTEAIGSF
jgi:anti-sigma B factor antagonist